MPFAVIGSNCVLQIGDKRIRARQYPWGVAEVENNEHCDFRILRDMLIRTHMQDLIDVTSVVHYENFRARKLSNVMSSKLTGKSPLGNVILAIFRFSQVFPTFKEFSNFPKLFPVFIEFFRISPALRQKATFLRKKDSNF